MRCDFNFAVTTDVRTRNGVDPTHEELADIAQIFSDSLALVMDVHLKTWWRQRMDVSPPTTSFTTKKNDPTTKLSRATRC